MRWEDITEVYNMSKSKKHVKKIVQPKQKRTAKDASSSDNKNSIWVFDKLDRNGEFKFDIIREDFDSQFFLDKMINYTNMTWQEIKKQTHDKSNKSKNHFISIDEMSDEAQERIKKLHLEEDSDSIFSFALSNKKRVLGIRKSEFFHVVWYDPTHMFCPIKKE